MFNRVNNFIKNITLNSRINQEKFINKNNNIIIVMVIGVCICIIYIYCIFIICHIL